MELITRQTQVDSVVKFWLEREILRGAESNRIRDEIGKLGPRPSPQEVDRIIGENRCGIRGCDECKSEALDALVEVGEEPNLSCVGTAYLCRACVAKALALFPQPEATGEAT